MAFIKLLLCIFTMCCYLATIDGAGDVGTSCSLMFSNDTFKKLQDKFKQTSLHVLYLELMDGYTNQSIFPVGDNAKFARVKLPFGPSLMTLPVDLTLLAAYLPYLFIEQVKIRVYQKPRLCIHNLLSRKDQQVLTLMALRNITMSLGWQIGGEKDTVCRRVFNPNTPLDNITVSCCSTFNKTVNCDVPYYPPTIVAFRFVSFVISLILSSNILKWLIQDVPDIYTRKQKVESIDSVQEFDLRIISNRNAENVHKHIKRYFNGIHLGINPWLVYIFLYIFSMCGLLISIWIQLKPYFLMPYPIIYNLPIPSDTLISVGIIATIHGVLTVIVVIPYYYGVDIKMIDTKCNRNFKISEKEFIFHMRWCVVKLKRDLNKLFRLHECNPKIIFRICATIISCIIVSPLVILNKLSLGYYVLHKAELITCRLCYVFHCNGYYLVLWKSILKAILYTISVLYCIISTISIWAFLQLIAKIFITSAVFIGTHSNFFASHLGIFLPMIHFCRQLLNSFTNEKDLLRQDILDLRQEIEKEVADYKKSDHGSLEIYFVMTCQGINVDLPYRLIGLRNIIKKELGKVILQNEDVLQFKQQNLIIEFSDIYKDSLDRKSCKVTFSQYDHDLDHLRQHISQELISQQEATVHSLIKQFYYDISNKSNADVAIPKEIYNYLLYEIPKVSTSLWQLAWCLGMILLISLCFGLAAASFHHIRETNILSDALSGTLLSYVTMLISVKYFSEGQSQESERKNSLKSVILQYIHGYTFFYTRGKVVSPFTQLIELFCGKTLSQKNKEIIATSV